MNEHVNDKINEIGGKIDTIDTLFRALISSTMGTEELTERDSGNLIYLLEDKIKDLKTEHSKLINELGI